MIDFERELAVAQNIIRLGIELTYRSASDHISIENDDFERNGSRN